MDVADIVAGLVFAQAMEINIIVCDSSGRLTFEIARNTGVQ